MCKIKKGIITYVLASINDEFVKLTENSSDASHQKTDYLNKKIFDWKDVNNDPEADSSSFNDHRQDVIASTVEYSLTNSIANFNNYFSSDYSKCVEETTDNGFKKFILCITNINYYK